jgi:hypothetical protein
MKKIIFDDLLILLSKETKNRNLYFMHDWIKFGVILKLTRLVKWIPGTKKM